MKLCEDRWLADIMDRPCFRLDLAADPNITASPIGERLRSHPTAFCYAKVGAEDVRAIQALSAVGFFVCDVNVVFERTALKSTDTAPSTVDIAECSAADSDGVLAIAGSCFRFSRFHLDPLVPALVANAIKREWVRSYIGRTRGDRLFVARVGGAPIGFLASLVTRAPSGSHATIDLVGVASTGHNNGIGGALCDAFIAHYTEVDSLNVGTQAANIASVRMYEKRGFRLRASQYVLHLHVRNGHVLAA
jgi:ribosomal protein S18 acetylase RimI-like enzyme